MAKIKQQALQSANTLMIIEQLKRIMDNRFIWVQQSGERLPFDYMERGITRFGRMCIYNDDNIGLGIFRAVQNGMFNIYEIPTSYTLYSPNGLYTKTVSNDDPNLIIIRDRYDGASNMKMLWWYAEKLGTVRNDIERNLEKLKTPYLLQAPKEKLLDLRMAIESYRHGDEIVADDGIAVEEMLKVLRLDVPYLVDRLEAQYNTIFQMFLREVGYSNITIDKREKLTVAEALVGSDLTINQSMEAMRFRVDFQVELFQKFGILAVLNQPTYSMAAYDMNPVVNFLVGQVEKQLSEGGDNE